MAGSTIRNLTAEPNGTVELYAIWATQHEIIRPDPNPDKPGVASAGAPVLYAAAPAGGQETLVSYTKTYTYDLAGNRTSFVLTKNGEVVQSVTYSYDNLNRLATVSEDGVQQASYAYDVNGNRSSLTYANGVVESYDYNKANWVVSLGNIWRNQALSSFAYTYYASGSQRSETDHTGKVASYVYDGLGRLIQEAESNGSIVTYYYDAAGNRARMAVTGTESYVTTYAYDANNRLLMEARNEGSGPVSTTYTYDTNGNTLTESAPAHDGEQTHNIVYTYNDFNQLIGAEVDGLQVSYAYNSEGIRTAKRVGWQRTVYLLDGGDVVGEIQNDAVSNTYLRGINLIRRESAEETEYYLFNAHADVVTTADFYGAVCKEYDYDAFGNEKNPDPTDTNPFRYCGEYLDAETGSYYLRARYYDPTIGRFTQQDTHWNTANMIYGDALSLSAYAYVPQITAIMQSGNLYVYGINCPTTYVDHNGNFINMVTGFLIGGLMGGIEAAIKGNSFWKGAAVGAATGAASGIIVDATVATGGVGAILFATGGSAAVSAVGNLATQMIVEEKTWGEVDKKSIVVDAVVGGISGALSFGVSGGTLKKTKGGLWHNLKKNAVDTLMEGTTETISQKAVKKTTKVISEGGGKAVVRKAAPEVAKKIVQNAAVQIANTAIISGGAKLASTKVSLMLM